MKQTSQLESINLNIKKAVEEKRISQALELLNTMAQIAGAPWNLRNQIKSISESFGYLRRYALDNTVDPQREKMFESMLASVSHVAESIVRFSLVPDSPKLYFSVLRYEGLQNDSSIPQVLEQLESISDRLGLASLSANPYGTSKEMNALQSEYDSLSRRMFELLWVTHPLSVDDEKRIVDFFKNDRIRIELREHLLSAILLGALEYYDERRLVILAKVYLSEIKRIEVKALVGLILAIWMQRDSVTGRSFQNVMESVREHKSWKDDLKMVFLNLVRTRDTDRITRTMKEEVIPEMMKLRPELLKKFKKSDLADDMNMSDINPEWEELFSKSDVAKKLQELNELQSEGGDVMLSTFASLKVFPFFHNVSNWFMPFYLDQTDVGRILGESAAGLGEMIDVAPLLCDSDKYSMVFSLENMPSANRRAMLEQFQAQSMNIAEIRNSMLNPEMQSRSNVANRYIQDLYRFFTLFRKKNEFRNPFALPINLAAVKMLSVDLNDNDALEAVGEFYFRRKYYSEALEVFRLLLDTAKSSASMLQKAGFCCQQTNNPDEAYTLYKRSELLAPDSLWTIRRIAQTLRLMGRHAEAIPYYERLSREKPEDAGIALNLGHCYLAAGDTEKALNSYYKAEYFDSTGSRALRPLAWCTFVEGDYDKSQRYYDKILSMNPEDTDFLNAGHLALVKKNYRKASELYRKFLVARDSNISELDKALKADSDHLLKAGVDPVMIALTVDAAQYPDNE